MVANKQQLSGQLLQKIILSLLGESQLNLLGKYNLMVGSQAVATVPSIQVKYPQALNNNTRVMVKGSGIECVIDSQPKTYRRYHHFSNSTVYKYWEVIMDQHHPTNGLDDAVEALMRLRTLYIPESPIIRPAMTLDGNKGVSPSRAILYVCQAQFLPAYF